MKMIFLGKYTANALGGLIAGSDRKAAVETLLSQIGGKLEEMMFTRGEYDIVVLASAPGALAKTTMSYSPRVNIISSNFPPI